MRNGIAVGEAEKGDGDRARHTRRIPRSFRVAAGS